MGVIVIIGTPTLISNHSADDDANITISSNINSTYDHYMFVIYDIHPATDDAWFGFQFDVSGGSSYAQSITSSNFKAYNNYSGSGGLQNQPDATLHEETTFQSLGATAQGISNAANSSMSAILHLVTPSNTSFFKNFFSQSSFIYYSSPIYEMNDWVQGLINNTAAITQIKFQMSSGNVSGNIDMYGIA